MNNFPAHLPIDAHFITSSEAEVLWLSLQGLTVGQIAQRLSRSPKTISRHRENIRLRFDLTGHHTLDQFALRIRPELEKWVK